MQILLVEDEIELARLLQNALSKDNFAVDVVGSLREAELAVMGLRYDVILLDRGLPDGDGLKFLGFLRRNEISSAVLMLTARSEVTERVMSLDGGADDYLTKPFSTDELLARIRALGRRPTTPSQRTLTLGRLSFDTSSREAHVDARPLTLTRRELLVLETLVWRKGRTVMRGLLEERVYGLQADIQSNALDTHVSRLRSKLGAAGARVEIHAIRGVGYLMRAMR